MVYAVYFAPVIALGVGATIGLVAIGLGALLVVLWVVLSRKAEAQPARDQRPFHICPACAAYNAKFERTCWRCEHDMTKSAIEPHGELGLRLEEMDADSKGKTGAAK